MSNISVPVELQRILYKGSPHVAVVLSGKGTVVFPHGGHGVTDVTCVAHVSRSSEVVMRRRIVVEFIGGRRENCVF